MRSNRTRRAFLAGAAVGSIGVAGCLDSGGGAASDGGSGSNDGSDGGSESNDGSDGGSESNDGSESGETEVPLDLEWQSDHSGWLTASLEDVTTGETFTIDELDRPALVHTFAIWCSTCQRQHRAFSRYREEYGTEDAVPVELNVDPNEDAAAIREHAEEGSFDWHFAVSPSEVTSALVEDFGARMTSPPQSPVILVCPNGEFAVMDDRTVVTRRPIDAAVGRC